MVDAIVPLKYVSGLYNRVEVSQRGSFGSESTPPLFTHARRCPPCSPLPEGSHLHWLSKTSLRTAFTRSSQRHRRFLYLRRTRVFCTSFNLSHLRLYIHRARLTLPYYPLTLSHLPRRMHLRHHRRSRLQAAHTDGIPRAHNRGRWHDTPREGTRRSKKKVPESAVLTAGSQ